MRLLLMRIEYLPITRLTVHAAARLMLLLGIWKPILLGVFVSATGCYIVRLCVLFRYFFIVEPYPFWIECKT